MVVLTLSGDDGATTVTERLEALRAAHGHLLARRFGAALAAVEPWAGDTDGELLHALALAGSGEAARAAPALARIAAAHPGSRHPVLDLLPLVSPAEGARHLRAAIGERPDPSLFAALGALLAQIGPMREAIAAFGRAVEMQPGDPAAWSNLGKALTAENRFEDADEAFATALLLAPGDAQITYNRGVMLLKAGRFAEGWRGLRARHALPGRPPALPGKQLADLDVAGKTLLLVHDEGLGDTLQFIRYAKPLAERGARVTVAVPATLARLVATIPGVTEVTTLPALPRYDVWSPLLDVPALFGGPLSYGHYLRALEPAPALPLGRKIGMVWAGDPKGLLDHSRSMAAAALEPLRRVKATFVSLQKGANAPEWMIDPMPGVRDFADTAAIVSALDLVVSVDTSVAHLAAGMGKPVLLMDRYDNCWRWLSGRTDSPWYPTLRIVRQSAPGDWGAVVERIAALLAGEAGP